MNWNMGNEFGEIGAETVSIWDMSAVLRPPCHSKGPGNLPGPWRFGPAAPQLPEGLVSLWMTVLSGWTRPARPGSPCTPDV